ncbi:hypothetical protein BGHDH14_bgh05966 [Blumeria hordei DH14]|uniref:Methylcrotonoyl-CoA carboxylase subunit alpha, mitochondrial n=1 Tax=Blumeria graminis f. sp. hordei (strain DH14) TaxID=546991 RepID=N1JA92_BLUG1|nr:hypothetical protein BGHDH14_bgh05966 [Blumeria hordei DH14]
MAFRRNRTLTQAFNSQHPYVKTANVRTIRSVLIANRGEIALRVGRTASRLGIRCSTVYTDLDAKSQHALSSPFASNLGSPSAYLDGEKIIAIAKQQNCDALHPGYGFLSENSDFARRCMEEGLLFIGPSWKAIQAMGNKSQSKIIMTEANVPCIPGYHGPNQTPKVLLDEAVKIGFPVMIKAVKGGGGKGMRIAGTKAEFLDKLESAKREGISSFGDDAMLIEKFIANPRHIEVQIFGDSYGNVVTMGERDCSLQRRHQKIIEESPAPNLPKHVRQGLWQKAHAAALAVAYEGAGTVEFIYDNDSQNFFFMEMNTRLQVEHPVTEALTGEDLVHWQFKVAAGQPLPLSQDEINQRIMSRGWALEARIYAEDPMRNFMPASGKLTHLKVPKTSDSVRVDAGFIQGDTITPDYDGMIAKLIVTGSDRGLAMRKLHTALQEYEVVGVQTNIEFLKNVCKSNDFLQGIFDTGYIQKHHKELFASEGHVSEIFAQAALGLMLKSPFGNESVPGGSTIGFCGAIQRQFKFNSLSDKDETVSVLVTPSARHCFRVEVIFKNSVKLFENVTCEPGKLSTLTSFFTHTRIDSTVIQEKDVVHVYQHGKQNRIEIVPPVWVNKVMGFEDLLNNVFAPIPCKILRVEVKEGDLVEKNQPLVVIESMKMETIIRSPQKGVITKLVHKEGDICKAGTKLVLFAEVNLIMIK